MLTDKKLDKIVKALGSDSIETLDSLTPEQLKESIVQAESSMKDAKEQLEANENYVKAKEDLKLFSQGLTEVKKRQNAKIQYCLHLLEEKGAK